MSTQTGTNATAQVKKQIEALFSSYVTPFAFDLLTITPISTDISPHLSKLAGRNLLAAYSLLRC